MDLVNEQDRAFQAFELLYDGFQALLEIAAIARAGDERAHVERIDDVAAQNLRHFALDDLAREAFGDGGLADAGIADEQRIVLLAAAKDLDRALDLALAPDQRIDAAGLRLFVQIHAIGFECLGALLDGLFAVLVLVGAFHRLRLAHARALGDAVTDVTDRIEPRHVLLLQEVDGVALALREQRDQHIGARHLVAAGILHMQHRALDDAVEPGRGLGVLAILDNQRHQLFIDVFLQDMAQRIGIHVAGLHHLRGIGVVQQGEKEDAPASRIRDAARSRA